MLQKDVFLHSEANAWFERNQNSVALQDFSTDDLVSGAVIEIANMPAYSERRAPIKIVEIGCGEGRRLSWLAKELNAEVFGVEPSTLAVDRARGRGVDARHGTADSLPFDSAEFDILIFGFCLYLCDRTDLFRIAQEADRVLKPAAWLVIHDFFSPVPVSREYHHKPGVYSYKMDYRSLFDWHPAYVCYSHRLTQHGRDAYTDEPQEWVATSVLRKREAIGG